MNADYSQPFYVPIGKGRINLHTGQRGGYYLPALEPQERPLIIEKPSPKPKQEPEPKLHGGVKL